MKTLSPAVAMFAASLFCKSHGFLFLQKRRGISGYFSSSSAFLVLKPASSVSARDGDHPALKMSTSATTYKKSLEEVSPSYKQLLVNLRTLTQLKRASAVLDYDRMVMMPQSDETARQRGLQQSALASIIHEKATEPSMKELIAVSLSDLDNLMQSSNDDSFKDDHRILELAEKSYEKKVLIPPELEAKRAELSSAAYSTWVKAREAKDFEIFEECLEDCFSTAKELALVVQKEHQEKKSLYTQMLDEYEMGMEASRIDDIFAQIENALKPLIAKVLESDNAPSAQALEGTFDIQKQKEMNKKVITKMGFDLEHGRIDQSIHPFTMSFGPSDVRITSRFSENEWFQGLAATIHEGGHAMYEQNVGGSDLEIDEFLSMGMHESQSLFWERHIGMSQEFCKWLTPNLKEAFDNYNYSAEEIYTSMNAVQASPIRVEADELTYPLHVILRYNIERDVVEGRMEVKDIPKRWNEGMKDMLNVDIENDALGCLQDVHWSGLAIGYFPTYLIGSATAAQLAHYCLKDNPNMYKDIQQGNPNAFRNIKQWLYDRIHKHGKRYKSLDLLLEDQLGETLNPKYFIDYLTKKYTELYKC